MHDSELRTQIDWLLADGIVTDSVRRAYTSEEVTAVCQRLQGLRADDIETKLVVAGFTRGPHVGAENENDVKQSCATCMYFERHRNFCALPELMLPVEPQWSCILWRI